VYRHIYVNDTYRHTYENDVCYIYMYVYIYISFYLYIYMSLHENIPFQQFQGLKKRHSRNDSTNNDKKNDDFASQVCVYVYLYSCLKYARFFCCKYHLYNKEFLKDLLLYGNYFYVDLYLDYTYILICIYIYI
jgi:hypothetical protein